MGHLYCCWIPIQPQETPVGGRGRQHAVRMSTASHRCIYVPAAWPDLQTIKHHLEKDRDVDTPHPSLSRCIEFTSATAGLGPFG